MSVFSKVYEEQMRKIEEHENQRNINAYMYLRTLFTTTILNSFKWDKVPDFIKTVPEFIEESFFGSGSVAFFEDNGYKIAPCFPSGVLLENGLYSTYTMILRNGKTIIKNIDDIVLGFNNSLHIPTRIVLNEMIENCVRSIRAVDTSLLRAQLPAIFAIEDEQKISAIVTEIDKSYNNHRPYSLISSDWIEGELKKFDMYDNRATDILALWDVFVRYKNLVFTTFGINNVEITKTERLTQQESQANTEITRYGLFNDMFNHRRDFVDRVKEKFGYELTVEINRNSETVNELEMTTDEKRDMQELVIAPYKENLEVKEDDKNSDKD